MHIPHILRSPRSRLPDPPQADSTNATRADVPIPKHSLYIPKLFRFGRSRSQKPLPPMPDVSSSSCHSSNPKSPQGERVAFQTIPLDSARQHGPDDLRQVTPLVESNLTQTFNPYGADSAPPILGVSRSTDSGLLPHHQDLLGAHRRWSATDSQQALLSPRPIPPPRLHPLRTQNRNSDPPFVGQNIHESNVLVDGDMNYVNYMINNSNKFMAELLQETIQGAAVDSSARNPPPRCHPGTRLAILSRCLKFITDCSDVKTMLWVVGAAGVGKSAIMQNVAESSLPTVSQRASVFLSINGRNDGAKLIMTLVYQFAAQCEPYRQFVEHGITRDPALFQSTMSVQFKKFIVEPFIGGSLPPSVGRLLFIIDGLDECDKLEVQRELLQLIFDSCVMYPSSQMVWIIASRPEPHITSFFDQDRVKAVFEKEEIQVDCDEARDDVERFLRAELTRIQKEFSLSPQSSWPREQDFWKLVSASGGLFVYAHTVAKYIGDPMFGNPTSQLNDILKVIDAHPLPNVSREQHPMALLDALYAQILSKVPERNMVNTRKLLLALALETRRGRLRPKRSFLVLCNWLGMTCDDAYAAIRHLRSVLDAPTRDKALETKLQSFHKSFVDYISDFTRSGFSSDIDLEAYELEVECTIRVLSQAPDGVNFGEVDYEIWGPKFVAGHLARGTAGTGANISLSWSIGDVIGRNDDGTRLQVYKLAISNVVEGIREGESLFWSESYIHQVITRWKSYGGGFPFEQVRYLVFDKFRRDKCLENGILRQLPIKVLDFIYISGQKRLHFRRPNAPSTNLPHLWNPSCRHRRVGNWGRGKSEDWTTEFGTPTDLATECNFCNDRLKRQLAGWKTQSPEHLVTILFTSTTVSFVEFRFVDPGDHDGGVESEWTYWFMYNVSEGKRRALGSVV